MLFEIAGTIKLIIIKITIKPITYTVNTLNPLLFFLKIFNFDSLNEFSIFLHGIYNKYDNIPANKNGFNKLTNDPNVFKISVKLSSNL